MNGVTSCGRLLPYTKSGALEENNEARPEPVAVDHKKFFDSSRADKEGAPLEGRSMSTIHPAGVAEELDRVTGEGALLPSGSNDALFFPRCEYYYRFKETSFFANNIQHAHTYTRSASARYVQKNKKEISFKPTPLTTWPKDKSVIPANVGGYANPYRLGKYSESIPAKTYQHSALKLTSDLYDQLLGYKLGLCKHIAAVFRNERPYVDLGSGEYRVKTLSKTPTKDDFKNHEIIISKPKPPKGQKPAIALHVFINDTEKEISLEGNEDLRQNLLNSPGKPQQLKDLLKDSQPYLSGKGLLPNCGMQGVYCSNEYPCVLVRFTPRISDKQTTSSDTIYETYNHLLMAYFVAIVNYEAHKSNIPIEMVGRSSFGHNNPSIAVTGKSFRINIGLVPEAYADIVVRSLIKLYDLFHLLENSIGVHLKMDDTLRKRLDEVRKVGFNGPLPLTYWEALWAKGTHSNAGHNILYELIQRKITGLELLTNLVLEHIETDKFFEDPAVAEAPLKDLFDLIGYSPDEQERANLKNNYTFERSRTAEEFKAQPTARSGIYKTKGTKQYFQAILEDYTDYKRLLEFDISQKELTKYIEDDQIKNLDCEKIFKNYIYPKPQQMQVKSEAKFSEYLPAYQFKFHQPCNEIVSEIKDEKWLEIINKLCDGLSANLPKQIKVQHLYRFLEKSHIDFIRNEQTIETSELPKKVSDAVSDSKIEEPDWGSSSETEEPSFVESKNSIYAKKVIVANGMLAINLSYYAARLAILKKMEKDKTYSTSISLDSTYYETEKCLRVATNPPNIKRSSSEAEILIFDLNSFEADFIAKTVDLSEELKNTKPKVVILDHTSSTTEKIRKAIKTVYSVCPNVYAVLLVTSGLKNEQGGADINPYGKLTILSLIDGEKDKTLTQYIYDEIKSLTASDTQRLEIKALLPKTAHDIRRLYKSRGFATTTYSILHGDTSSELSGNEESATL